MKPLLWLLVAGCAFALSCRGCAEGTAAPSAPTKERQSDVAQLRERLSGRNLDRKKQYPKSDDGRVQCKEDADCFVIQGENCVPAVLEHTDSASGYGLTQTVKARYTISGKDGDKCQLSREVAALDVRIDPRWVEILKKQGNTDEDVRRLHDDVLERLREGNPKHLECALTSEQLLEGSLNLAERRYDPQFWRMACTEVVPSIGSNR